MTTGNPNGDTWTPRLAVVGDLVFGDIVPINLVPGSDVKVLEKDILCGDTRINIISKVMVRSSYEAFMSGPSCIHRDMCVFLAYMPLYSTADLVLCLCQYFHSRDVMYRVLLFQLHQLRSQLKSAQQSRTLSSPLPSWQVSQRLSIISVKRNFMMTLRSALHCLRRLYRHLTYVSPILASLPMFVSGPFQTTDLMRFSAIIRSQNH